jgi:hypothetical protein
MLDSLEFGWTPSLDIPAAFHSVPAERFAGHYVLVSMVDSTPQVARLPSLVPLLDKLGAFHAEVDDDVAIEVQTFLALVDEHEFFLGFDVIWLCTEIPKSGKPEHIRLTSDAPLGPEPPAGLVDWMLGSFCCAGLGDGDGLNFATFDAALAALWRE